MKTRKLLTSVLGVLVVTLLVLPGASKRADATPMCGPAPPNWIASCFSDTDTHPSVATHGIVTIFGIGSFVLNMSGSTTIFRGNPINNSTQIMTEMVSLNLSGGG